MDFDDKLRQTKSHGDYVNGSEENNDVLHLQKNTKDLWSFRGSWPIYSNLAMYTMSVVFVSIFAIPMSVDSVGSRVSWGRFLMLSKYSVCNWFMVDLHNL